MTIHPSPLFREIVMNKRLVVATFVFAQFVFGGCAPRVLGLSSHTINSGPDQQTDVVWVLVKGQPVRCAPTPDGPVCRQARTQ